MRRELWHKIVFLSRWINRPAIGKPEWRWCVHRVSALITSKARSLMQFTEATSALLWLYRVTPSSAGSLTSHNGLAEQWISTSKRSRSENDVSESQLSRIKPSHLRAICPDYPGFVGLLPISTTSLDVSAWERSLSQFVVWWCNFCLADNCLDNAESRWKLGTDCLWHAALVLTTSKQMLHEFQHFSKAGRI